MFRTAAPAAEPAPVVMDSPPSDLIPLSVIKLDLPEPGEGWGAFLAARDVDVKTDDIGRPSVTRATARMLIAEHASNEAKKALLRQDAERRAVEEDRERGRQLYRGIPVTEGLTGTEALLAAAAADNPHRRISPVEEALGGTRDLVTIRRHPSASDDWFSADDS
jgi:hypothetical protein